MQSEYEQDRIIRRVATGIFLGCGAAAVALFFIMPRLFPALPTGGSEGESPLKWAGGRETPGQPADWMAFAHAGGSEQDTVSQGDLSRRFRLAGTFFAFADRQHTRKAILDDLARHDQVMVVEGDTMGETVFVVRILPESIQLKEGTREEILTLSFSDAAPEKGSETNSAADPTLMETRFGKMVDTNRWLCSRSELEKYYQELMDHTDRLASMFSSMKPVYQQEKIAGYVLNIEGEGDFFKAVGLRENDVIRKVNSMPMTSQNRAEFFIKEFEKNSLNAFVLEIERDGLPQKLIYLIR